MKCITMDSSRRYKYMALRVQSLVYFSICVVFACSLFWAFDVDALGVVGTGANDFTTVEYDGLSPVAQVHVNRMFIDYERRGFFRIGLLPIPVAENVQIQIQSADCLTNALFELHSWHQPSSRATKIFRRRWSADLQSASGHPPHKAGCKPALRFGCGFAALRLGAKFLRHDTRRLPRFHFDFRHGQKFADDHQDNPAFATR